MASFGPSTRLADSWCTAEGRDCRPPARICGSTNIYEQYGLVAEAGGGLSRVRLIPSNGINWRSALAPPAPICTTRRLPKIPCRRTPEACRRQLLTLEDKDTK